MLHILHKGNPPNLVKGEFQLIGPQSLLMEHKIKSARFQVTLHQKIPSSTCIFINTCQHPCTLSIHAISSCFFLPLPCFNISLVSHMAPTTPDPYTVSSNHPSPYFTHNIPKYFIYRYNDFTKFFSKLLFFPLFLPQRSEVSCQQSISLN